ncbi:MAG: RluA family pseudouridine synthase [bacterium]
MNQGIFRCAEGQQGRLDRFLALALQMPRSQVKKLIQEGHVLLNGRPARPSAWVEAEALVQVCFPPPSPSGLEPEPMELDIIYEDQDVLVLNKQAGLVVHPGAGHPRGTLVNGLLAHCPAIRGVGGQERAGLVHRLDKDTTGVMVVAKSDRAHRLLSLQFKERKVLKDYLALVYGQVQDEKGVVELSLGRDPTDRLKISSRSRKTREARTQWEVLARTGQVTWLRARPETGRTHQIRVHLASMGNPVVGDPLYGGKGRWKCLQGGKQREVLRKVERQLLHAWRLCFHHPLKEERLCFQARIPQDLALVLEALGVDPSAWKASLFWKQGQQEP